MAFIDTENGPAPCPDAVAVIGGGRWARVLVDVLCGIVPPSVAVSVHSRRNTGTMAAWAEARGLDKRIRLSPDWPRSPSAPRGAAIVANAARDHEDAVESTLAAGIPTLVEKPIALTAAAAQRLADLAHDRGVRFAVAHVFLFARYLDNFAKLVAEAGTVESLRMDWVDPRGEVRYGEPKHYDASLPVLVDVLPHIVSIAGAVTRRLPDACQNLTIARGGDRVETDLSIGNIPCSVLIERNAETRRRVVRIVAGGKTLQLDFSTEPGTITDRSHATVGDPLWDSGKRPVASMLTAFLAWAAGGARNRRLDLEPGLRACRLADLAAELNRTGQSRRR